MSIKEFEKEAKPLIEKLDKDGDPYLFVHFSKTDDRFSGFHERMDFADATIVINELMKRFKIKKWALQK